MKGDWYLFAAQNVLGLEVTMHDALFVHMIDSAGNLMHNVTGNVLEMRLISHCRQ